LFTSLVLYSYLQMLDLLTTTAFLLYGVREANPLVRMMLENSSSPLMGLVLVKGVAVALGIWCWRRGRQKLLTRMNVMFGAVVGWNMVALIVNVIARA
jgi:hypothetical protein